jgi:hypothetical protein
VKMVTISRLKKMSVKKRVLLIIILVLCALTIYSGIDQVVFNVRKPKIDALARNYLAGVEKVNTYGSEYTSLAADELAAKKAAEVQTLLKKYFLPEEDGTYYARTMTNLALQMKQKKAKLISFSISPVNIKSMEKMPWKLHYDVKVFYQINASYTKEADYFDGEAFDSSTYGDGKHFDGKVHSKKDYCLLALQIKESGGIMKISGMSMSGADSEAELEKMQSGKANQNNSNHSKK